MAIISGRKAIISGRKGPASRSQHQRMGTILGRSIKKYLSFLIVKVQITSTSNLLFHLERPPIRWHRRYVTAQRCGGQLRPRIGAQAPRLYLLNPHRDSTDGPLLGPASVACELHGPGVRQPQRSRARHSGGKVPNLYTTLQHSLELAPKSITTCASWRKIIGYRNAQFVSAGLVADGGGCVRGGRRNRRLKT